MPLAYEKILLRFKLLKKRFTIGLFIGSITFINYHVSSTSFRKVVPITVRRLPILKSSHTQLGRGLQVSLYLSLSVIKMASVNVVSEAPTRLVNRSSFGWHPFGSFNTVYSLRPKLMMRDLSPLPQTTSNLKKSPRNLVKI